jgi:hypothetical protein
MRTDLCETTPDVDDSTFALALTPGMKVRRMVFGGNPESVAPANLESEGNYLVDSWGRLISTDDSSTGPNGWLIALLLGCTILLSIGITFWYKRWKQTRV